MIREIFSPYNRNHLPRNVQPGYANFRLHKCPLKLVGIAFRDSYDFERKGQRMSFAERLRVSRKEKGYSQEILAEKLNVSRQTVTKWETENAYPEMKTLLLLSVILQKDLDWLFSDDLLAVRVENNQSLLELERKKAMDSQISSVSRVSKKFVDAALEELQTTADRVMTRAGYSFIDEGRGWINQVYILYGVPAIGKTAFALNIVNNVIRSDGHAAYFDLSRPVKAAMKKLLGISANISTGYSKEYDRVERARLQKAGEMIRNSFLYLEHVYEDPIEKIHEKCINIDPHLDLIVIDGADHLFSTKASEQTRRNDYWVSQELQEMVRSCQCPVLLLKEPFERAKLQLERAVDEKEVLAELEETDGTEGEAWLFQRHDYYKLPEEHDHTAELVMKRRFAERDPFVVGKMQFDPDTLRLTEI